MRTTAFRTKQYAGMDAPEFGETVENREFKGVQDTWERGRKTGQKELSVTVSYPEWCRCTVYRELHGRVCKFVGPKVYWLESYATVGKTDVPNEMWRERPIGQLEKCAEAAALRRAFPEELGNELSADEMSGRVIDGVANVVAAAPQEAFAPPPVPKGEEPPRKAAAEDPKPADPKQASAAVTALRTGGTVPSNDEWPDLPESLDRRKDTSGRQRPDVGEGAGKDEGATRHGIATESAPAPEPPTMDHAELLQTIQEWCANSVAEANIDELVKMYEVDINNMPRDFRQRAEAAIAEGYERLRKPDERAEFDDPNKQEAWKPEPFEVPEKFSDRDQLAEWINDMIGLTNNVDNARRLHEAFRASKVHRANLLSPEAYDRMVEQVKKAILPWQKKPEDVAQPPIPKELAPAADGMPATWEDYCAATRKVMAEAKTAREIQVDWLLKTADLRNKLWPSQQAYENGLKREIRDRLDELHAQNGG
jgi:hypothetical protein